MNTVPTPRTRAFTAVALGLAASVLLFSLLVYARSDHSQEVSDIDAGSVGGLTPRRVEETDPPFWDYDCQISISPASPTQYDPIQVSVGGEWGDSCVPLYQSHQVVHNGIGIHFLHDPAPVCAAVMTPWGDTADVGALTSGVHTAHAYINGGLCGTKSFTVSHYPGCVPAFPMTLAAYQAWFGLDSHIKPPPYTSTDPIVISGHITAALAQGIDGFVVDWYGPEAGAVNDKDRKFIDQATSELLQQSGARGFCVALMYDEGTVSTAETLTTAYTTRVISDLLYARRYFTMPGYLHIDEHPALFVFPYELEVDPYVDWVTVTHQLGITVTLFDKDPNPKDPEHDSLFDGFYAWVQPTGGQWSEDGTEWGEGYLTWFYDTMATPSYTNSVTVGGVWPGFDDTLASWGSGRYMWRRCGQTWRDTWRIVEQYDPPIVMIDTWNDFEEGTDIEYGIGECLAPSRQGFALPGDQTVYTHTIANTGKFTDTFYVSAVSSRTWPLTMAPITTTLVGHASITLAVSLTVPETARSGTWDRLVITATSGLSAAVHSSVVDTTTVSYYTSFLPVVLKDWS